MSRYLLVPKEIKNDDAINGQIKEIELPLNIVPIQNYKNDQQKKNHERFLQKLDKFNIKRNKDGLLKIVNKVTDIDFDNFVSNCCKQKFSICYEDIYCTFREKGITF